MFWLHASNRATPAPGLLKRSQLAASPVGLDRGIWDSCGHLLDHSVDEQVPAQIVWHTFAYGPGCPGIIAAKSAEDLVATGDSGWWWSKWQAKTLPVAIQMAHKFNQPLLDTAAVGCEPVVLALVCSGACTNKR